MRLFLLALLLAPGLLAADFDLLIRIAHVVDSAGKPRFLAVIGVEDGKIAAIGRLSGRTADEKNHRVYSNPDPFDLVERHLIRRAVVELGGARRLMRRDCLGALDGAAAQQYAVMPVARKVWQSWASRSRPCGNAA